MKRNIRPRSPDFSFQHLDDGVEWFKAVMSNNPADSNRRSFDEVKGKPVFNPVGPTTPGRKLWYFWDGKVGTNAEVLLNKRRNHLAYL